jgi:hypothetical protein
MKRVIQSTFMMVLTTALLPMSVVTALGQDIGMFEESQGLDVYARKCIPLVDYYDSRPFHISAPGETTLVHDLGGDPGSEYLVFFTGLSYGLHNANYGTASYGTPDKWMGAEWQELDGHSIKVVRAPNDSSAGESGRWDQGRVLILKVDLDGECYGNKYIPLHSYYNSGLVSIEPGQEITLWHSLGGDPRKYLVFVYGYNNYGYHHANYGTASYYALTGDKWIGGEWYKLDEYRITIVRAPEDEDAPSEKQWDKVRVIIIRLLR